jgi:nucleoside-diphosphate-sugar epimerase
MRVLVTGATGFVGRALCQDLPRRGWQVSAAVRKQALLPEGCEPRIVGDIGPGTDWTEALKGVDAVTHLAARVHIMRERAEDPLASFRRTNVEGTLRLARAAARAGVGRFVFLSSVQALGGASPNGPLTDASQPKPEESYGISKCEAEVGLREIANQLRLEVVILRPPLVYGPGVKGNFRSLMNLVDRRVPLPLKAVANRRSLLYLGNLVDAIALCLEGSAAANRTYLLRDGEDLSTAELVRRIGAALGHQTALFPVPASLLKFGAGCVGRAAEARRLLGSLIVDDRSIRQELEWNPPFTVDEGLAETAAWFRATLP